MGTKASLPSAEAMTSCPVMPPSGTEASRLPVAGIDDREALSAFFGDEKARLLSERRWNRETHKCRPRGGRKKFKTTSCTTH